MFHLEFLCILLIIGYCRHIAGSPMMGLMGYENIEPTDVWLRLHTVPATWADARVRCQLDGGVLASPTTSALVQQMMATMAAHNPSLYTVFTGINALVSKGDFMTLDGKPVANLSVEWADGEPNNVNNGEDCVAMKGTGTLVDVSCGITQPYFCRKNSAKMNLNSCGTTDNEYWMVNETSSCYKFHVIPRTWHQAAAACSSEGGHLAIINSRLESKVLKELFAKHPDDTIRGAKYTHVAMIGFWDWNEYARSGELLTIFGQTLAEAGFDDRTGYFAQNVPKTARGIEYCGSIVRNGLLNVIECDAKAAFICEITP